MLRSEIRLTTCNDESTTRWVEIANMGGVAGIAHYRVSDLDASRTPLAATKIENYPRWSEPMGGLVARALNKLWSEGAASADQSGISDVCVETSIVSGGVGAPRILASWRYRVRDGFVESWDEEANVRKQAFEFDPRSRWPDVVVACQCLVVWSDLVLPTWPTPLAVPIRRHNNFPYVRLEDIPASARAVFRERMWHSTRPLVPGEGICFYAWDWSDFLSGLR